MEMGHHLTGVPSLVEDEPISIIDQTLALDHILSGLEHAPDYSVVLRGEVGQVGKVAVRYHEKVYGCLWRDVSDDKAVVIAVEDLALQVAVSDPAEDTLFGHSYWPPWGVLKGP